MGEDELQVSPEIAEEIALVGIIPSSGLEPIGYRISINGQPFVVIGYATREEFVEAAKAAGLPHLERFRSVPLPHFLRLSTD